MRFFCFVACVGLILSSCSIAPYSAEKNCSERGLNALKSDKSSGKISEEDLEVRASLRRFYQDHTKDLQSCYQNYLDNGLGKNEYAVCAVSTVSDGKLTFLDISDKENGLNSELQKCLEDKFHSFDFKFIQSKKSYTVQQPLSFRVRRQ